MRKIHCNECAAHDMYSDAKWRIPYLTGYDVCQRCYDTIVPSKLKEKFVKI